MPSDHHAFLTVLHPGLLTTVQDLGRYGYGDIGMPTAGVMDAYAARVANILLGNDENAAVLEITVLGPVLAFHQATAFVIAGADMQPCLNRQPIGMWRIIHARTGDRLSFAGLLSGCRAYLAVSGGVDVPLVMDSASTYLRGKIGGYEGRALRAGDQVNIGRVSELICQGLRLPAGLLPGSDAPVRVVPGPQNDAFTQKGIDTFLGSEYVVTPDADRMGYRLDGPAIEFQGDADIISDGMALGAVQVPAQGRPIIMLADHQTAGGYAKIAHVISVDIPVVAQKKTGDSLRFAAVSMQHAQQLYREREQRIARLKDYVRTCRICRCSAITEYTLIVNGQRCHARVEELT